MNKYIVQDSSIRLDAFISNKEEKISRTLAQKLIKEGKVLVDNEIAKPSTKLKLGQTVELIEKIEDELENFIAAEDIPLNIIYEDEDIVVINKPKNMVVHPAVGNKSGTLVNALIGKTKLSSLNENIRPGIVHRLDKDTTGILVVAKNNYAHAKLAKQMQDRDIKKIYITLVRGIISENAGVINMPIARHQTDRKKMAVKKDGKEALTNFNVVKRYEEGYTLVEIELKTGRTHQIRVHMSHIGYPVVGDSTYSSGKNPFGIKSQMLHAYKLGFTHPTNKEWMEFEAPLPSEFKSVLLNLKEI